MATMPAAASAWVVLHFYFFRRMAGRSFSSYGAYIMGMLVDHHFRQRYYRPGCYNGWDCPFVGFLFNHVMVENAMAEFK